MQRSNSLKSPSLKCLTCFQSGFSNNRPKDLLLQCLSHGRGKKCTFRILSISTFELMLRRTHSWAYNAAVLFALRSYPRGDTCLLFLFWFVEIVKLRIKKVWNKSNPRVTWTQFMENRLKMLWIVRFSCLSSFPSEVAASCISCWTIDGFVPFPENDEYRLCETLFQLGTNTYWILT